MFQNVLRIYQNTLEDLNNYLLNNVIICSNYSVCNFNESKKLNSYYKRLNGWDNSHVKKGGLNMV